MQISRFGNSADLRSIFGFRLLMGRQEGNALVEFALTMPVLIVLVLGAAELGSITYASVEVANAARAGVSYGCQTSTTAADTTGIQNTAAADAPDVTLGTTTVTTSCICSDGSASTCKTTDCSTSNIETILTVQTQASVTPLIHIPAVPTSFTVHGQAVQKVLQ